MRITFGAALSFTKNRSQLAALQQNYRNTQTRVRYLSSALFDNRALFVVQRLTTRSTTYMYVDQACCRPIHADLRSSTYVHVRGFSSPGLLGVLIRMSCCVGLPINPRWMLLLVCLRSEWTSYWFSHSGRHLHKLLFQRFNLHLEQESQSIIAGVGLLLESRRSGSALRFTYRFFLCIHVTVN